MKVALGTVIYNEAYQYCQDFIYSVNSQCYKNFDVLIINDNCSQDDVETIRSKVDRKIFLENNQFEKEIYKSRIQLIEFAKRRGYDLLILTDFDDKFSNLRVKNIVNNYESSYTFFYNSLFDYENKNLMPNMPVTTNNINDILEFNYLGMTNTAINLNNISNDFIISLHNGKTKIFDWYLYSRMLIAGYIGKFIPNTNTYYRIHDNNVAGITKLSIHNVSKEIDIKIHHYQLLEEYNILFMNLKNNYLFLKEKISDGVLLVDQSSNEEFWWGIICINNIF